jgi:hypothetical protein
MAIAQGRYTFEVDWTAAFPCRALNLVRLPSGASTGLMVWLARSECGTREVWGPYLPPLGDVELV